MGPILGPILYSAAGWGGPPTLLPLGLTIISLDSAVMLRRDRLIVYAHRIPGLLHSLSEGSFHLSLTVLVRYRSLRNTWA